SFFFQAEDGIRDFHVTGVQTCALPIFGGFADAVGGGGWGPVVTTGLIGNGGAPRQTIGTVNTAEFFLTTAVSLSFLTALLTGHRSEERRVGKAGRLWGDQLT